MRRSLVLLVCLLTLPVLADAPLTNDDVIKMVSAGLAPDVIIEKITTSPASFETSTEALVTLANAKVPDAVIKAMLAKTGTATPPAPPSAPASPPVVIHGIRYNADAKSYQGDLAIDERGATFCCATNLQTGPYARCFMSFRVPLDTITTLVTFTSKKLLPGMTIIDVANQRSSFYFVADDKDQSDQFSDELPKAIARLHALKPEIKQEEHDWSERKHVFSLSTEAHITTPSYCDEHYEVHEFRRK